MTGYHFNVDCPDCGGELNHLTGSTAARTEAIAIAECESCGHSFRVSVHLRPSGLLKPKSEWKRDWREKQRKKVDA